MSEKDELFEALRKKSKDIAFKEPRKFTNELVSVHWMDAGVHEGIDATIEALKEMMVGEPMEGKIRHTGEEGGLATWTIIQGEDFEMEIYSGHHGTDGEKVAVCVLRKEASDER